jgi:hypothetical protein
VHFCGAKLQTSGLAKQTDTHLMAQFILVIAG